MKTRQYFTASAREGEPVVVRLHENRSAALEEYGRLAYSNSQRRALALVPSGWETRSNVKELIARVLGQMGWPWDRAEKLVK